MTIEADFEKQVLSEKLTEHQVIALVRESIHEKIENSGFAQNTRFTKMSRVNQLLKRLYATSIYKKC